MHTVVVEPSGLRLSVADGESVAEAAWRQGYTWPTTCWGQAECTICWVAILEGADRVSPVSAEEECAMEQSLTPHVFTVGVRLACRLQVHGDGVVLEKRGVRPPPDAA